MSGTAHDGGRAGDPQERIESYLDTLLLTLRGRPREVRRLLTEVEAHLRESVAAGVAAGLDTTRAVDEALDRFGPPSAVARGLPRRAAYGTLLGQTLEAVLVVVSALFVALGVAAVPAAVLALAGNPAVVTGDQGGTAVGPVRCQQLLRMISSGDTNPGPRECAQALTAHHLEEVLRAHMAAGLVGVVVLAAWWTLYLRRRSHPSVLPAGFTLTVCSTLLAAVAAPLLVVGIHGLATHSVTVDGLMGSGDLVTTGGTVLLAALLCYAALARQATRPARNLAVTAPR